MRTPIGLATLLVVGMASPGSALDVGLGGAGGSIGAGASLGGGVSLGTETSLGGGSVGLGGGASLGGGTAQAGAGANLGGASAGVGLDAGTGSRGSGEARDASSGGGIGGIGIGANANIGAPNSGTRSASAGAGVGAVGIGAGATLSGAEHSATVSGPGSKFGSADAKPGAAGRSERASPMASLGTAAPLGPTAAGSSHAMALPTRLLPFREIHDPGSPAPRATQLRPAIPMRKAYRPILSACRTALAEAAVPYGATKVDVAVTGTPRRSSDGGLSAPVEARIVYSRSGRTQVRQARVTCQFDAGGQVVAAL